MYLLNSQKSEIFKSNQWVCSLIVLLFFAFLFYLQFLPSILSPGTVPRLLSTSSHLSQSADSGSVARFLSEKAGDSTLSLWPFGCNAEMLMVFVSLIEMAMYSLVTTGYAVNCNFKIQCRSVHCLLYISCSADQFSVVEDWVSDIGWKFCAQRGYFWCFG